MHTFLCMVIYKNKQTRLSDGIEAGTGRREFKSFIRLSCLHEVAPLHKMKSHFERIAALSSSSKLSVFTNKYYIKICTCVITFYVFLIHSSDQDVDEMSITLKTLVTIITHIYTSTQYVYSYFFTFHLETSLRSVKKLNKKRICTIRLN